MPTDADPADESDVRNRANEADGDETAREWRFGVDDVGPDGVTEDTSTPETEPIEPGTIETEHAVFVALGVALTVGVLLFGL